MNNRLLSQKERKKPRCRIPCGTPEIDSGDMFDDYLSWGRVPEFCLFVFFVVLIINKVKFRHLKRVCASVRAFMKTTTELLC